jgi:hypothetical protein
MGPIVTGLLGAAVSLYTGIEQKNIMIRQFDPIAAYSGIRHGQDIEVGLPFIYLHQTGRSIAS